MFPACPGNRHAYTALTIFNLGGLLPLVVAAVARYAGVMRYHDGAAAVRLIDGFLAGTRLDLTPFCDLRN